MLDMKAVIEVLDGKGYVWDATGKCWNQDSSWL